MDHAELFLVFSQSTKLWHEAGTGPLTCACHPFAVCTWRTSVNSFIQRPFVESAQNLTPENLRAGVKPSMHRRVTCPQWWSWSIMRNLPPQRECSSLCHWLSLISLLPVAQCASQNQALSDQKVTASSSMTAANGTTPLWLCGDFTVTKVTPTACM